MHDGETQHQDDDRSLTPEEYEQWKSERAAEAHEQAQQILDIEVGGSVSGGAYLPRDISVRQLVFLLLLLGILIAGIVFRYGEAIFALL